MAVPIAVRPTAGLRSAPPPVDPSPVVSVCIANWNGRALLRRCLDSVFENPQGVSFEVVVVDNASADGAADMVAEDFPQVRLVRNPANLGFSRANNQAATVARGRYLFFLNNDTELPPFALRSFVDYAEANPAVGMLGPRLVGLDGGFQVSYRRKPTLRALLHRISFFRWIGLFRRTYYEYRRATFDPAGVKPVEVLMGAAVFLPRAAFETAGRWEERYRFGGEDLDLSTQVGKRQPVVFFGDVDVRHTGRVASRANVGYVAGNVAVGYATYLRRAGVGPISLAVYKACVTLDAPVVVATKWMQSVVRSVRGRPVKAVKSRAAARGAWHFLTRDLVRFWRA
jgi:GT2 family glycosyltransferase